MVWVSSQLEMSGLSIGSDTAAPGLAFASYRGGGSWRARGAPFQPESTPFPPGPWRIPAGSSLSVYAASAGVVPAQRGPDGIH